MAESTSRAWERWIWSQVAPDHKSSNTWLPSTLGRMTALCDLR